MRYIVSFVALILLAVGCRNDQPTTDMGISVTVDSISVDDIGGRFLVGYSVKEAVGSVVAVALSEAEWITDIDNSTFGIIRFRVLPNEGAKERVATIELRYPGIDYRPTVTVTQSAFAGEKLRISLDKVDYSECRATITPHSDDMTYVVMMAEKSYFTDQGITTRDEVVEADIAYFMTYVDGERTIADFLQSANLVVRGKQSREWQDLSPAKEYVVYAYGVDVVGDDYQPITPIYYEVIGDRLPERREMVFDATITAEGPEVHFDISPKEWNGYYMVQLVEDSEAGYVEQGLAFSEEAERAVAEAFFYVADHLYYFNELSAEEVMQEVGYKGDASFDKTLNANHRYMAIIYAIDSDNGNVPMMVSKPVIEYFSTGTVERSDMTFAVEFENIRPRSVDVRITPSTDEQYTAVMMYAKNLPDGDKYEQLDYVVKNYAPLELSGIYEEHIDQLPPATEFILALYGYYAGVPTTDLFVYRFTTKEDGEGKNRIVAVECSAYDLAEVAAVEPYYQSFVGYADYFLSVDVTTAEPSPTLHFDIFPLSVYEEYGEEAIRESLLEYSYTSSPDWALCTYGNEYVVCGLAEDESGYIGELFVSEPISFTKEQTADAKEFVELYKDYIW